MRRFLIGAAAAAVLLLPSTQAEAAQRCGQLRARWNVPAGAAVVTRTEGIVGSTFDAVGRYWTHIVVSDGQDGIFQSHRGRPRNNSDWEMLTNLPIEPNSLRAGGPGPSHTNIQGTIASMQGVTQTRDVFGGELYNHALFFTGDSRASTVHTFLDSMRESAISADAGLERLRFSFVDTGGVSRFAPLPYSFLNFRSSMGAERGIADPRGFACSNFLAWAANRATGAMIPPETFTTTEGLRGLKAAHDRTENDCHAGLEGWEAVVGVPTNACGRAGEQVANCLSGVNNYGCNNRGSEWKNPANWFSPGSAVTVLGPDRVVNWGAAATSSNPSPWAQNATNGFGRQVSWSEDADGSGAEPLGCWGEAGDAPDDDPGHATDVQDVQNAPNIACTDITINVPEYEVHTYHRGAGFGDTEMDGNHPRISGSVSLRREGDTLVSNNFLTMTEGGGDRSSFANADSPSAFARPVYVAPPQCTIAGFAVASGASGSLLVADAGGTHAEIAYGAPNTTGVIRQARCVSDTDGEDSDKLYCKVRLQPITVQLRPRVFAITLPPGSLPPFTPPFPFTPTIPLTP